MKTRIRVRTFGTGDWAFDLGLTFNIDKSQGFSLSTLSLVFFVGLFVRMIFIQLWTMETCF